MRREVDQSLHDSLHTISGACTSPCPEDRGALTFWWSVRHHGRFAHASQGCFGPASTVTPRPGRSWHRWEGWPCNHQNVNAPGGNPAERRGRISRPCLGFLNADRACVKPAWAYSARRSFKSAGSRGVDQALMTGGLDGGKDGFGEDAFLDAWTTWRGPLGTTLGGRWDRRRRRLQPLSARGAHGNNRGRPRRQASHRQCAIHAPSMELDQR